MSNQPVLHGAPPGQMSPLCPAGGSVTYMSAPVRELANMRKMGAGVGAGKEIAMKAWRVHQYGAPREVLRLDDVDAPQPGAGELLIRVTSVTLNFNDLDGIHGRYKTVPRPVPYIPGMEVLGIVEACGTGV